MLTRGHGLVIKGGNTDMAYQTYEYEYTDTFGGDANGMATILFITYCEGDA